METTNIRLKTNNDDYNLSSLVQLKKIIAYFSYLNNQGEISDKAFNALIKYAFAAFVENQIEIIIQEKLEPKILTFFEDKISKIIENYIQKQKELIKSK